MDKSLILDKLQKHYHSKSDAEFARFLGIKPQTLSNWYSRNTFDIGLVYTKCLDINPEWLLTGNGEMLKINSANINHNKIGSPYYNVDFIGGFDLVLNDQTVNPEYYIDIPPYNKPGYIWCNLYGKSMEPAIWSGDRIVIREIQIEDIISGKIYGIITKSGMRTIKWVSHHNGDKYLRLIPENKDPKFGEYQDINIEDLYKVFEVMASVRMF